MEPNAVDLKAVIDLVRRRYLVIVGAVLLCLALAGVSLLVLAPAYTATALVMVEPGSKDLLARQPEGASSTDALRVDSEVELVKSEATLLAVVRELDLGSDAGFAEGGSWSLFGARQPLSEDASERRVVDRLRGVVDVQRRGLTFLIAISARASRPDRAAQIANAVARAYIRDQLDAKVRATVESRDIVASSLERAGADVARSEDDVDAYIDDNIQRIGEATGRADLAQLRQEIAGLAQSRAAAAASVDAAEAGMAQEDWAGLAAVIADEGMSALEQRRLAAEARLAATTGAEETATLRSRVAEIEAEMRQRAAEAVAALRATLAGQQVQISELRGRLRRAILDGELPADVLAGLYARQQGAEIARQQYQTLLARKNELDTQAILQVADSRIVAEASPPGAPSFPSPRLFLGAAVIAGVALGLVLALSVEYFVGGITSVPQAEAVLRVPALASIPRQRAIRRGAIEAQSVADTLVTSPLSAFSESIRRLRIGLDQAMRRRDAGPDAAGGRVVVVASAAPAEGRTTVALALARAYALSGVSTLLIDCDLRKPTIHKLLGMGDSEGLLDYLAAGGSANADLKSIIVVDGGSGARVIFGARRSNMVTDQLIASATFARLIEAARDSFDVVILDTPPIGAVVDGLYLAGIADAIAFVVRWSSTPQQDVRAAVTALGAARRMSAPILTVVNQDDSRPGTRRGKYADYYAEA